MLELHEGLRKAESLLAVKLRTKTYGLDGYLYQARVFPVPSPLNCRGRGCQTVKRVHVYGPRCPRAQHQLR
jgi:hypothetical protein